MNHFNIESLNHFSPYISRSVGIFPLLTFRVLFGSLMAYGSLRFMLNGWIEKLFVEPQFHFKYYGFSWVKALDQNTLYGIHILITIFALMIALGFLYKFAAASFFTLFTYVELIDATNYLNHYYLVCLLSFLLIFIPANKAFSLDVLFGWTKRVTTVPAWTINILIFQISVVYFFAGLGKLNYDWMVNAMPLAIWLPEKASTPIIGALFTLPFIPYLFSWFGAFYDLSIAFFLLKKSTQKIAYVFVVLFHLMTKVLFNIGLFPFIMIFSTLIFFRFDSVQRRCFGSTQHSQETLSDGNSDLASVGFGSKLKVLLLSMYILIQVFLPLRHYLYPGNVLWTEEGYRFSWRVMLLEKTGQATFTVEDPESGRSSEVINAHHLTQFQEKQMAIQPDFILQYANYLEKIFQEKFSIRNPIVRVKSHVSLNGRSSQVFIDPTQDLTEVKDGFNHKNWIGSRRSCSSRH